MSLQDLRIGDCEVYFTAPGSAERFLGQTKGGVTLNFEREFADLTVDKYGGAPIDMALTGNDLTIVIRLVEMTNANLEIAMPEARYASGTSDSKIGIGTQSGYLLSSDAGLLRLHPRRNTPSNLNEDIYIWKAVSAESVELNYQIDEQRVLEVTFRALVDDTQSDGEKLGRVGDATIS